MILVKIAAGVGIFVLLTVGVLAVLVYRLGDPSDPH